MRKKTWISWTCSDVDDERGHPQLESPTTDDAGRTVWQRPVRKSWLERSFEASLLQPLARSIVSRKDEGVRMDVVERIKAEIAAGRYRKSAEALAEKIIQTMRREPN